MSDPGSVALYGVRLEGNVAAFGGGMLALDPATEGAALPVVGCTIVGNTAHTQGGGLYIRATSVDLNNTLVAYNTATANGGGGVFVTQGSVSFPASAPPRVVTLAHNTSLLHNVAATVGGGLVLLAVPLHSELRVLDATIAFNTAGAKGAGVSVTASTTATVVGGPLVPRWSSLAELRAYPPILIERTTIAGNTVPEGFGAGLAISGLALVGMRDVAVHNNVASSEGGGMVISGVTTMMGCEVVDNVGHTGAGITLLPATDNVLRQLWRDLAAVAAAAAATNASLTASGCDAPSTRTCIQDTLVQGNVAQQRAGGLYVQYNSTDGSNGLVLQNTSFVANTARTEGAALLESLGHRWEPRPPVLLAGLQVKDNQASAGEAGGISVHGASVVVRGGTFEGNAAGNAAATSAGALLVRFADVTEPLAPWLPQDGAVVEVGADFVDMGGGASFVGNTADTSSAM